MLKNKIDTYFFKKFVQESYEKVSVIEGKEEVYYRKNKLAVVVKDEEVGRQIYDIIKNLKDNNVIINTQNATFEVYKYISDEDNRVQVFYVFYTFNQEWCDLSETKKLQELVSFTNSMQTKGYILDDSKFENENCNCISSLLSFFTSDPTGVESSNGCLIKYIHYVLSGGGDLNDYYQTMSNKGLCEISEFPYNLPIIRMCYEYFLTGTFETGTFKKSINNILDDELWEDMFNSHFYKYLILDSNNLEKNLKLVKKNDEYAIYDENIKIYHNMSSEFEKFIKEKHGINKTVEQVDEIIVDINEKIIGYKFLLQSNEKTSTITEINFANQHEILAFMSDIKDYISSINSLQLTSSKICKEFNLEDCVFYTKNANSNNFCFKIDEFNELFNIICQNKNMLNIQIVTMFFKIYIIYLNKIYGNISDEKRFFEKMEVRYLSPILAREFVNYSIGQHVNYEEAAKEFLFFLANSKNTGVDFNFYDSRFEYNPTDLPFIFNYEVKEKYGINIEETKQATLSDGRKLVIFGRKKNISSIKSVEDGALKEIKERFNYNSLTSHIHIIKISEIIYSKTINNNGMYDVIGYITTPFEGKKLSDDILANLNNRDFIKVSAYLFSEFNHLNIPLECIYMDDDFSFYIDIQDKNFKIKRNSGNYTSQIISHLIDVKKCSPNNFVHIKGGFYDKARLIRLADSLDVYCDEHKIYYDSSQKMCPICLKTKVFIKDTDINDNAKIFEDKFAIHYRVNNANLKVYKSERTELIFWEKNIDNFLLTTHDTVDLKKSIQSFFVPYKKAYNSKNEFIGYIYDRVEFDNENDYRGCINLKDAQQLKNLPRLKCLIRLIIQVKEIISNKMGFISNPFGDVFLAKDCKKQVQILNLDFLSKSGSVADTKKWTCEYICQVLAEDEFIDIDISDSLMDLDHLLTKLQILASKLTKYCSYHKMYYSNDNLFCPKCVDNAKLKNIEIKTIKKYAITQKAQINEGGESFIYSYDKNTVAKVFKETDINLDLKNKIILSLLDKKEILEEVNTNKKLKYKYIIPKKLFVDIDSNSIFGYLMDKVDGTPISSLRDKSQVEKFGFSREDIFEILITVGEGIENLHKNNIYIGDLNGRNILFDSNKNVYFLDFDGMGIDDIAPEFCTDGYIDPVSKKNKNITMKDDWYSFAIQAFYYLTLTHPFNGIYYFREGGKKVALEITDKMERKISLLGNHGTKPPAVAIPWDWMDKELVKAFLNIFEGNSRQSIVPYLIRQYQKLYKDIPNQESETSVRINQKFIATCLTPFKGDVVRIINPNAAICTNGNEYYISMNGQANVSFYFNDCMDIKDILLSEDENLAFLIYENRVVVFDIKSNTEIYKEEVSDIRNVVVNGRTLYFTGISEQQENIIFKREFMSDEAKTVNQEKIKFLTNLKTKRFYSKFNSKFVMVKHTPNGVDEIYCNSDKLCNMSYNSKNSEYNIIYDSISKLWLVVNSEGKGIVINSKYGSYEEINIPIKDNWNVENISFNKGTIYIPTQDSLHVISVNNQFGAKKMECCKIMTPDSKVYNINNDGFNVLSNDALYEVRRG